MSSLLALCAVASLLGACEAAPKATARQPAPPPHSQSRSDQALCATTGGLWHPNLRTCACAGDRIFSIKRGCMSAPALAGLRGEVHVGCTDHDACKSVEEDAHLRAQLLSGIAVDPPRRSFEAMVSVQAWSPRATDAELRQIAERPAADMLVRYDLRTLLGEGLSISDTDAACRGLIATQWPQATASERAVCGALTAALGRVQNADQEVGLVEKVVGSGRGAIRYAVANLGATGGQGLYNLVGRGGHYYTRTLEVSDRRHLILSLVLSPRGHIMGGHAVRHAPPPHDADHLLQRDVLHFDRAFAPLAVKTQEIAPRAQLSEAVGNDLRTSRQELPATALATDGAYPPLTQSLRALVMESAIDPRVPGLWQRMAARRQEAQALASLGKLDRPLFPWADDPVEAALQLAPEVGGHHGTLVAALLAADLPNLKISLMTGARNDWTADPAQAQALLLETLRAEAPQVVNISRGYEFAFADCAAVFGPVLEKTEKTILFVASAGNADVRNAPHICPASLAPDYSNLIAVAGVHPDGTLGHDPRTGEPTSNYGDMVEIAAPVCAEAEIYGDGGLVLRQECGTSVAAPRVANAALRILARQPDLSPEAVKQLLMATCDGSGLDVACGGALDLAAIEAQLGG